MEWLETDGLGGFAMGNASGIPMRRYHALLNVAYQSPANRICLLNAVEVYVTYNGVRFPISTYSFGAENLHPNGIQYLKNFLCSPHPKWDFNIQDIDIQHEIFMQKDSPAVYLHWKAPKKKNITFEIRPFISGRSYHSLHSKNNTINLEANKTKDGLRWQTYNNLPSLYSYSNAEYLPDPLWFENVVYDEDRFRGADYKEDWASPGIFKTNENEVALIFSSEELKIKKNILNDYNNALKSEQKRRAKSKSALSCSADAYIVKRGEGKTIIAGYPWFADWGRDTFISLRGLCLANNRLDDAKVILTEWSKFIKDGLLPNRFVEEGQEPEYNSVDAALWYIISSYEYILLDKKSAAFFTPFINTIIDAFKTGTHYNIKSDPEDGLLRAGQHGSQLTWMDAKIGDYVVTPRIGKPVEIQALWLNALKISYLLSKKNKELFELGVKSFNQKFWNPENHCLFDVIDVDYQSNHKDSAIRPNQLFAIGGLPFTILDQDKIESVVSITEKELYTQTGIRTLSPNDSAYCGNYTGDNFQRDSSYHQGTVWPWLMGTFIESWLIANGSSKKAKKEAYTKFFMPFIQNINNAGLGHLSEIHDGNAPFKARGCPFQAWSVAEALRLEKLLLS